MTILFQGNETDAKKIYNYLWEFQNESTSIMGFDKGMFYLNGGQIKLQCTTQNCINRNKRLVSAWLFEKQTVEQYQQFNDCCNASL